MNALPSALASVQSGWSARQHIIDRAAAIRDGHPFPHDLADEIDQLQGAEDHRFGIKPRQVPGWAEVWLLAPQRWAERLIGAHMVRREVYAPVGCDAHEAARFANRHIQINALACVAHAADMSRAPVALQVAA
jgi:hypothetical protein